MSELNIYRDDQPSEPIGRFEGHDDVAKQLTEVGVRFERWQASKPVSGSDSHDDILAAYREDIDRLVADEGYRSWDVIAMNPDHPDKAALREKFLSEHTHSDDEVRFFVAGAGLFSLHIGDRVYEILCGKGDLIGVPADTRHWFDMGPNPEFVAIRLFDSPDGWEANYTGSAIADGFARLDN